MLPCSVSSTPVPPLVSIIQPVNLAVTKNADLWFPLNLVVANGAANKKGFVPQGWDKGYALFIVSADLSVPVT